MKFFITTAFLLSALTLSVAAAAATDEAHDGTRLSGASKTEGAGVRQRQRRLKKSKKASAQLDSQEELDAQVEYLDGKCADITTGLLSTCIKLGIAETAVTDLAGEIMTELVAPLTTAVPETDLGAATLTENCDAISTKLYGIKKAKEEVEKQEKYLAEAVKKFDELVAEVEEAETESGLTATPTDCLAASSPLTCPT